MNQALLKCRQTAKHIVRLREIGQSPVKEPPCQQTHEDPCQKSPPESEGPSPTALSPDLQREGCRQEKERKEVLPTTQRAHKTEKKRSPWCSQPLPCIRGDERAINHRHSDLAKIKTQGFYRRRRDCQRRQNRQARSELARSFDQHPSPKNENEHIGEQTQNREHRVVTPQDFVQKPMEPKGFLLDHVIGFAYPFRRPPMSRLHQSLDEFTFDNLVAVEGTITAFQPHETDMEAHDNESRRQT